MDEPKCENCKFFDKRTTLPNRCRRMCPAIGWTCVDENDWCGEWRNKKNMSEQEIKNIEALCEAHKIKEKHLLGKQEEYFEKIEE